MATRSSQTNESGADRMAVLYKCSVYMNFADYRVRCGEENYGFSMDRADYGGASPSIVKLSVLR